MMIMTLDEIRDAALKAKIVSARELHSFAEDSGVSIPLAICHRVVTGAAYDYVRQRTLLKLTKVFRPGLFEQNRPRKGVKNMAKPKPMPKPGKGGKGGKNC